MTSLWLEASLALAIAVAGPSRVTMTVVATSPNRASSVRIFFPPKHATKKWTDLSSRRARSRKQVAHYSISTTPDNSTTPDDGQGRRFPSARPIIDADRFLLRTISRNMNHTGRLFLLTAAWLRASSRSAARGHHSAVPSRSSTPGNPWRRRRGPIRCHALPSTNCCKTSDNPLTKNRLEPSPFSRIMTTIHENAPETVGRLYLSLNGLATDLDTERGGTDANKRDGARQLGRLNVDDLQL
jgi:hypothetical protein